MNSTTTIQGVTVVNGSVMAGSAGSLDGAAVGDFAAVLEQSQKKMSDAATPGSNKKAAPTPAEVAAAREAARQALHAQAAQELKDYLAQSPAQRLRAAVLREMGLTEEELAKMPPDKRNATEAEINRRIREHLLGHSPEEQEEFLRQSRLSIQSKVSAAQGEGGQGMPAWSQFVFAAGKDASSA